jgi:hypothetical protein
VALPHHRQIHHMIVPRKHTVLRKWLVQQQSCPTCRADIAATEALEASRAEDRLLDADFVPGFHP